MRGPEFKTISVSKDTFVTLFLILVLVLMFFPLMATFNDILTRMVINLRGYWFIREVIVPFEVRLVAVILTVMGFTVSVTKEYVVLGESQPFIAEIVWNFIGWQSLVILFVSLKGGLVSGFTRASRLEALTFALVGTFLMNLARISAILIILYYFGKQPAAFFHNYVSIVITISWLFFFWWFSYTFVLEEKAGS